MHETEQLKEKLAAIADELRAAVDLTLAIRARSPRDKDAVMKLWEEFLGQFFGYIKQRSKEVKDNLLAGISWTRMKLF